MATGLNKIPLSSTGIIVDNPGRANIGSIPARSPSTIRPASRSSHKSLLPPVYGAGP